MSLLLKISIFLTFWYLFYILFLRKETFFNTIRLYFLIGILLSFAVPTITIPIYVVKQAKEISNNNSSNVILLDKTPNVRQNNKAFNFSRIISYVYVIGVLFFTLKLILEIFSLIKIINKGKKYKEKNVCFVELNTPISPFSVFNYLIFSKNNYSKSEFKKIIAHEKIHIKQYHTIDLFLANITTTILWFLPMAWLYKKHLQENLEFIADKSVVSKFNKKEYQYLLLKSSISKYPFALSNNFYQSLIKKRIIMLQKTNSQKVNQFKILFVLPLIALFLFSFNSKEVIVQNHKTANKQPVSKTKNKEFKGYNVAILKNTTDKELATIEKDFSKKNKIDFSIFGVRRNVKGEIIAIKLKGKTKVSTVDYNYNSNDKPISTIFLLYDKDKDDIVFTEVDYKMNEHNAVKVNTMYTAKGKVNYRNNAQTKKLEISDKSTSGSIKYQDKTYFYIIKNGKYTFYNRYGDEVPKNLVNKLIKALQDFNKN